INGGLEHLDPHSAFINAREYRQFSASNKGRFGGIGIQIDTDKKIDGALMVISPIVGTPAYAAGILAGDYILKINGKSTETMRIGDAVEMIKGEPGEKLTLNILHDGQNEKPHDVEIVRAEIDMPSVLGDVHKADNPKDWEYFVDPQSKIAYVRLV